MYYPDVPALDPEDIELLCNEYIAHNKHLDPPHCGPPWR